MIKIKAKNGLFHFIFENVIGYSNEVGYEGEYYIREPITNYKCSKCNKETERGAQKEFSKLTCIKKG